MLGEIVVTAEKLHWLINNGEQVLKPCKRGAGVMVRGVRAVDVLIFDSAVCAVVNVQIVMTCVTCGACVCRLERSWDVCAVS